MSPRQQTYDAYGFLKRQVTSRGAVLGGLSYSLCVQWSILVAVLDSSAKVPAKTLDVFPSLDRRQIQAFY